MDCCRLNRSLDYARDDGDQSSSAAWVRNCIRTLPRRATSITAPGMMPSSIFFAVASSIFSSWAEERPTYSGFAIGTGISARAVPATRTNASMSSMRLKPFMCVSPD